MSGSTIGRYAIIKPLGHGGMGHVYLARDPDIDRHVAIKVLHQGVGDRQLLLREAKTAGQLRHPAIVTIFDVQEHEDALAIVMEYVPGRTLAQILEGGEPLAPARVLEIVEGVCGGLLAAHRADVIHRDIKPANIMVDDAGFVKILDFGIAKSAAGLTSGSLVGTLSYMPPERVIGNAPGDGRSDIFSLCLLTCELVTRRRVFDGSFSEVTRAIAAHDGAAAERIADSCPSAMRELLVRGLQPAPADRFQDMAEMIDAVADARARLQMASVDRASVFAQPTLRFPSQGAPARRQLSMPHAATQPLSSRTPASGSLFGEDATADSIGPSRAWSDLVKHPAAIAAVVAIALAVFVWGNIPGPEGTPTSTAPTVASGTDASIASAPPQATAPAAPPPGAAAVPPAVGRGAQRANVPDSPVRPIQQPPDTLPNGAALVAPAAERPAPVGPSPRVSAPPPNPEPALALSSADAAEITRVIDAFETAFRNQSSSTLKRLQPSLTEPQLAVWDNQFLSYTSYSVDVIDPVISLVTADRARVDCTIIRHLVPREGGAPRTITTRPATIVLDRDTDGWVISSVRGVNWQ